MRAKLISLGLLFLINSSLYGGFDFGNSDECGTGSGTFKQNIEAWNNDLEKTVTVGTIPKDLKDVYISLNSKKDVDIRLYDANGVRIVHWPHGMLFNYDKQKVKYNGVDIEYSGYKGDGTNFGHEYIKISGTTQNDFIMKAFGYEDGYATVEYSWAGKANCTDINAKAPEKSGSADFEQDIVEGDTVTIGDIPKHINNLYITLSSDEDVDIQLFDRDTGREIIAWPNGILNQDNKQMINYNGMLIEWSGYKGDGTNLGHEYIRIYGETTSNLIMRAFGYKAGNAKVHYEWGESNRTIDINNNVVIRFLNKATFGATKNSIKELKTNGIEGWLDRQLYLPLEPNIYLKKMITIAKKAEPDINPYSIEEYLEDNNKVFNKEKASFHSSRYRMSSWFDLALTAKDQLRHKVAYALSQIIVESDFEPIFTRRGEALARYFDILYKNAFGNYQDLLNDISFSSGMGLFLTYNGNKKEYINKADVTVYPDENYAREIMQLFSIGLNELNIDGTPKKDNNENLIPTYTQEDVNELSKVFTGWDTKQSGAGYKNRDDRFGRVGFTRGDFTHPLEFTQEYHDFGEKKLLGETIPANLSGEDDIKMAVNIIMNNPNIAPYISKNLIMRLTKSNPSPDYVERVATVFNSTHGDLKAVIKAIFLDKEILNNIQGNKLVKFKEPLIAYTNFLRAFNAKPFPKWYFCDYGSPKDETASNCNVVENKFLFNDTRQYLNQGAGLAPTVFNFYDNSFIPNNENFKTKNMVAPETEILTDTIFINYSNTIRNILTHWDKQYILSNFYPNYKTGDGTLKHYNSVEDFANDAPVRRYTPVYYVGADKMLLDTSEELCVMEMVIDGDCNNDFKNLKDYRENYNDDEKAIKALVSHLNKKLTGGLLTADEELTIYNSLKDVSLFNKYNVHDEKHPEYTKIRTILLHAIYPAIRAVVTSSTFMTE